MDVCLAKQMHVTPEMRVQNANAYCKANARRGNDYWGGQPGKAEKMQRYSSLQMNLEREEVKEVKWVVLKCQV